MAIPTGWRLDMVANWNLRWTHQMLMEVNLYFQLKMVGRVMRESLRYFDISELMC